MGRGATVIRFSLARKSPARVLGFFLVLLVLVLGSAVIAQAAPSLPATITGYVKDSGGTGIANVLVEISGDTSQSAPWDPMNQYFSQEATTDATGKYVITDVIQGTYQMYVNNVANQKHLAAYSEAVPWHGPWADDTVTLQGIIGGTTYNVPDITLADCATIQGRARRGATGIGGAGVFAQVTTGGVQFSRWTTTSPTGFYTINDATPGDWTVTVSGKDREIPMDAVPSSTTWDWLGVDAITVSPTDYFSVAEGAVETRPDTLFELGREVRFDAVEENTAAGSTFWLPDVAVNIALDSDPDGHTYQFRTVSTVDGSAYGRSFVPSGTYTITLSDGGDKAVYWDKTAAVSLPLFPSATPYTAIVNMTPRFDSYAVYGRVSENGTGDNVASWITASLMDPSSPATPVYYKRVPSNGSGLSLFLIRLPKTTGFSGNKVKLEFSDQADPPSIPYEHVTRAYTAVGGPSATDWHMYPSLYVGGSISGTIHDRDGFPVDGCMVAATRIDVSPYTGENTWMGADNWYTRTNSSGNYTIGGLPTDTDYKVNVIPDYNPGMALDPMYQDYYRRTYKNQPLVDSLNTDADPPGGVVDHTAVPVTLGAATTGIDETITPGGYVALHADGPLYPTGSVWCDVMYRYGGQWFEIDSGYTTGGTFAKKWKVLPKGHYKLMYHDYFGRGGGTWEFDMGALGEAGVIHKYASVIIPTPATVMSGSGVSGAFAGVVSGGLIDGGTGGVELSFATTATPPGAPPLPSGYIPLNTRAVDVSSIGASADGIWTLTMPYDPAVPDSDVPYLRIMHYKTGGAVEVLSPIAWNTLRHTVMVQTTSLSPFRVVYRRHGVGLGTPQTSGTWNHTKKYTVYGSLSPKHTYGAKSVKIVVYRRNSRGKYTLYKTFWAPNTNYRTGTRYSTKFSLKSGRYRFYATAVSDKWHVETKTRTYKSVTVK
jgi:hypothetical protein